MKKLRLILGAAVLCLSGAMLFASSPAVHLSGLECGMIDGDGNFVLATGDAVVTSSGNGNLKCQAQVPNSTGKAVVYSGFPCGTPTGVDNNGHETVSASGQATLVCHGSN